MDFPHADNPFPGLPKKFPFEANRSCFFIP